MGTALTAFLQPTNLDEAIRAAEIMAASTLVPKQFQGKAGDILIAGQMGAELGVSWTQALQNIAVINGRPTIWGDLALALVTSHPDYEYHRETYDEDTRTATCVIKRKSSPYEVTQSFSWADACEAGLNSKDTYKMYRRRMLQMRARSWAIRDCMPDALRGISMAEEMLDVTPRDAGEAKPVIDVAGAMDKLKGALDSAKLEGPKVLSDHPDGSPEWWADAIRQCRTPAKLEQIGFELKSADPDTAESLRDLYREHAESLRNQTVAAAAEAHAYDARHDEEIAEAEADAVYADELIPDFFGGK